MLEKTIDYISLFVLWSIMTAVFINKVHQSNKLQLECSYYMQRAIENNKEDKIAEYQPQCADYLSFLTNQWTKLH